MICSVFALLWLGSLEHTNNPALRCDSPTAVSLWSLSLNFHSTLVFQICSTFFFFLQSEQIWRVCFFFFFEDTLLSSSSAACSLPGHSFLSSRASGSPTCMFGQRVNNRSGIRLVLESVLGVTSLSGCPGICIFIHPRPWESREQLPVCQRAYSAN